MMIYTRFNEFVEKSERLKFENKMLDCISSFVEEKPFIFQSEISKSL